MTEYKEFIDFCKRQKIDYIQNNPVVAGIVAEATGCTYSSANPFSGFKGSEW
jgi:hypothetical protein